MEKVVAMVLAGGSFGSLEILAERRAKQRSRWRNVSNY